MMIRLLVTQPVTIVGFITLTIIIIAIWMVWFDISFSSDIQRWTMKFI